MKLRDYLPYVTVFRAYNGRIQFLFSFPSPVFLLSQLSYFLFWRKAVKRAASTTTQTNKVLIQYDTVKKVPVATSAKSD